MLKFQSGMSTITETISNEWRRIRHRDGSTASLHSQNQCFSTFLFLLRDVAVRHTHAAVVAELVGQIPVILLIIVIIVNNCSFRSI
jgi:hypothetical protein